MKNSLTLKSVSGLFVASMILVSCAQSDQVVSNKLIQKRKYNKGFFVSKVSKSDNLAGNKVRQESSKNNLEAAAEEASTAVNYIAVQASVNESAPVINIETEAKKEKTAAAEVKSSIVTKMVSRKLEKLIEKADNAELNSKVSKKKSKSKSNSGGESQLVALVLVIFVGAIGIHRFYLGYTWQGVVQLLTLGLCGIWSFIDFIRIITGDLKPKTGGYSETL